MFYTIVSKTEKQKYLFKNQAAINKGIVPGIAANICKFAPLIAALKKVSLKIEQEYEFVIFAIVTSLPEYRLCWHLNAELNIGLGKQEDFSIESSPLKKTSFIQFIFHDELTHSVFYLFQNKADSEFLLPEIKEADFVLMIKGSYFLHKSKNILKKIKKIELVQTAWEADVLKLKSKKNLIFDDDKRWK